MDKKFRIGIVGAGAIVESSHIPVLQVRSDVVIEWIYDRDPLRSELLSRMFNIPVLKGRTVEDGLDEIDICLLTIPYGARKEYINVCARKKKALYVEKPFAVSTKEHMEYCGMFASYDLAIGFQRRYYEVVDLFKNIVDSGIFGQLKKIKFSQGYFALKGNKEFLSNAALSGGGVIIESAIHTLDQILLISGSDTLDVIRTSSLEKNGIDYDTIFYTSLMKAGIVTDVEVEVSTLRNLDNAVHFIFEHATASCGMSPDEKIRIFDNTEKPLLFDIGSVANKEMSSRVANSATAAFYCFWNDFLRAIESKTPNRTSAINSVLTTQWIEMVYKTINKTL